MSPCIGEQSGAGLSTPGLRGSSSYILTASSVFPEYPRLYLEPFSDQHCWDLGWTTSQIDYNGTLLILNQSRNGQGKRDALILLSDPP